MQPPPRHPPLPTINTDTNTTPITFHPSLPIPHPSLHLLLTTPRLSDSRPSIPHLNHPSIYLNLTGPPYPYTQEDFTSYFHSVLYPESVAGSAELLAAVVSSQESQQWPKKKWVHTGMPFPTIREVDPLTGVETMLGQIDIRRRTYVAEMCGGEKERQRLTALNSARGPGDPETEWEIGFWLSPTHHGHGIMPAVLSTLIREFMVSYMNVKRLSGTFLEYNQASRRVFEKCGFTYAGSAEGVMELPEIKMRQLGPEWQGKKIGVGLMVWDGVVR